MTSAPPVLLDVVRSGFVESQHRGSFVLIDPDGSVAVSVGTTDVPVFPRSSLKPLQATAMVENGFAGRGEALALAAASHSGEDVHIAGARATLAAAGLDESALQCPADLPIGRAAMLDWVGSGGGVERICHNCSGKHASMLATCVAAGWPTDSYRAPDHPLQRAVHACIERLSGERVTAVGVDGCGAPAFAISLVGLARAFARVITSRGDSAALVADAMRAHPRYVGGLERPVTELMSAVPGLLAKDGAECVWGAALPDGRAFAVKAEDGNGRAQGPLLAAALWYWRQRNEVVERWANAPVFGAGEPVGAISWSAGLRDLLALPRL